MKAKSFLFILTAVFMSFLMISCGEETDSGSIDPMQKGTVLNRDLMRRGRVSSFSGEAIRHKAKLPPLNAQTWQTPATGLTKCYDNEKEIDCENVGRYKGQDGQRRYGVRSVVSEHNNEVIRDLNTQLSWTRQVRSGLTWSEAKSYCESIRLANKTWRLPTTAELRTLVNYGTADPAIDPEFTEGVEEADALTDWFWASKHTYFDAENEAGTKVASAWIINFYDGFVEYTSRHNKYSARCVTKN